MSYFAQSSTHQRVNQDRKAKGLPTLADTEILRLSRVLRDKAPMLTDAEIQMMLITDGAVVPTVDTALKVSPPLPVKDEIASFAQKVKAAGIADEADKYQSGTDDNSFFKRSKPKNPKPSR